MLSADPRPYVLNGQGKYSTTLLTEDGCIYPVISPLSHSDRRQIQSATYRHGRGVRPMHRTTMQMAKPAYATGDAYKSSSNQYFSGSKSLSPVRRPPLCPSMHRSQWQIGENSVMDCNTNYKQTYLPKEIIPRIRSRHGPFGHDANRLHLVSFQHKIEQTEGGDMKQTVQAAGDAPSYLSQYNRVQGKLGLMLGPGVPRERPVRQSFNILTGEELGPAWKPENRRVSGNRFLQGRRSDAPYSVIS